MCIKSLINVHVVNWKDLGVRIHDVTVSCSHSGRGWWLQIPLVLKIDAVFTVSEQFQSDFPAERCTLSWPLYIYPSNPGVQWLMAGREMRK